MKTQVNSQSDLTPSLGDLLKHGSGPGEHDGNKLLLVLGLFLFVFFSCMCPYRGCGLSLEYGQLVTKRATGRLLKPLTDHSVPRRTGGRKRL